MTDTLSKQTSNILLAKEESLLDWNKILEKFKKIFGSDVYESWIKNASLKKEFNHYVILSVPTRFVRDWLVSRYADKMLDVIQTFKKSIQRLEFSVEDTQEKSDKLVFPQKNKITSIENSLLNYNRFSPNNNFDNFIVGDSNELAYTAARKVCIQSAHYNPLFIYSSIGIPLPSSSTEMD